MTGLPSRIQIVEVGPRDGLQNETARIPTAEKIAFVDRLSAAGHTAIEVSAFVSPKWVPQMADAADVFAGIRRRPGVRYTALVPNLANHYFYAAIKRMLHDAERDGYRLIVADSDEDVVAERELGGNLLHQTDGLILCSPRAPTNVIRQFVGHDKPVVVLNRPRVRIF